MIHCMHINHVMWVGFGYWYVWMITFRESYEIKWPRGRSMCMRSSPTHYTLEELCTHYTDVIMGAIASQITSFTIVYSTVYSGADQRKHQSSASLAFVRGIHRKPVNSLHKWPVTRKMFPFYDVVMSFEIFMSCCGSALVNLIFHVAFAGIWKINRLPLRKWKPLNDMGK